VAGAPNWTELKIKTCLMCQLLFTFVSFDGRGVEKTPLFEDSMRGGKREGAWGGCYCWILLFRNEIGISGKFGLAVTAVEQRSILARLDLKLFCFMRMARPESERGR
jgi:hypothetical protein